jgi:hypothetical protein
VSNYRTRHSLYLGAELELYVDQQSACGGYWIGVQSTDGDPDESVHSYTAVSLESLRRAADSLTAVVERLEREEGL